MLLAVGDWWQASKGSRTGTIQCCDPDQSGALPDAALALHALRGERRVVAHVVRGRDVGRAVIVDGDALQAGKEFEAWRDLDVEQRACAALGRDPIEVIKTCTEFWLACSSTRGRQK